MDADGIVGRRRELDALHTWLDAARAGAGRLVLCGGEPGIGKTRLAQELAGLALAQGTSVAWGRCVEAEGAPAYWPWRQVLRSLGGGPRAIETRDVESPEDRFQLFDDITEALRAAASSHGLVVILDDIHWADEPSLRLLRHVANHVSDAPILAFATFRDAVPADLLRAPAIARLDLRGFGLAEVREQLSPDADARAVLDMTGGNPLFVREVARSMADGTWRPDRIPRSVVDVVTARLDQVSPGCRRFVQAAAIVGRDFTLAVVASAVAQPVGECLPLVDEAIAAALIDRVGHGGEHRFVHALTREAVEASLTTAERATFHRAVAQAIEAHYAADLSEHLTDIARHWAALAPYGEAAAAHRWTVRAAEEATRRLAYEEAVRLYRTALDLPASLSDREQCLLHIALGRAAYFAGDLAGCVRAATDAARAADRPELLAESALVLEAAPDPTVTAVAKELCERALAALGDAGQADSDQAGSNQAALRARLLAQRSHLAYYDGDQATTEALSASALALAREAHDDHALGAALRARKEACPGPSGRAERTVLAGEMLELARRTNSARTAMWGELWRIDALIESGAIAAAADELSALALAVDRTGGPVSRWHLDRVTAYVAQAQGRLADAQAAARRAFDRMRPVEAGPAQGAYFSLQCALARHFALSEDAVDFVRRPFDAVPRFRTMGALTRAFLLLRAGLAEEAAASYQRIGPLEEWSLPAFFVLPVYAYGALVAAELGFDDDLDRFLALLEPFRGEHIAGEGVIYLGPVALALGRGAAARGRLDDAVNDLGTAAEQAARAGAQAFTAEAQHHLAVALVDRNQPGDLERAQRAARDADRLVRALGMSAYADRTAALVTRLGESTGPAALSVREVEVANLVAAGLSNRQIAERLIISERTAQNHVQHILTKLGFTARSQIAAWMSTRMSNPADGRRTGNP